MFKKTLFLILVFSSMVVFPQVKQAVPNTKPDIYLIGAIHSMHFDVDKNYSINDLLAQILALKPDLICGEITPEAFAQPMEGYFPPEAALLAEMATELNYRFEPVDWRLDHATQSKAANEFPVSVKEKRDTLLIGFMDRLKSSDSPSMYDFIHNERNVKYLDILYEEIIGVSALAEIANGSWSERNRRIVENGLAVAENARTIVFVFGVDHLPQIQRYLKDSGFNVTIPQRLFVPGQNHKASKAVQERWKRNMENLILIRDKKLPVTHDNYQKVIHSRRIQDLEQAIQKSL